MDHPRGRHPTSGDAAGPAADGRLRHRTGLDGRADRGAFQADAKTVRKWCDRFVAEGPAGLEDRYRGRVRSPNRLVVVVSSADRSAAHEASLGCGSHRLRTRDRGGHRADRVATRRSGRLDRGDRATDRGPVQRYQHERPGELVHVDVKNSQGSPTVAAGASTAGATLQAGSVPRSVTGNCTPQSTTAHDLPTRKSSTTSKARPPPRSGNAGWSGSPHAGSRSTAPSPDNGACYRSFAWRDALAQTNVSHSRTRPYRPQTNGKVERFHLILLEEWAYIRDRNSDQERHTAYDGFMHFYNQHRSHGALGWATPIETITRHQRDASPRITSSPRRSTVLATHYFLPESRLVPSSRLAHVT